MQLKPRDVYWCLSDPGWIIATLWGLLEPWTAGSTIFTHHLPQFDPKVIVEVRRLAFRCPQTAGRSACFGLRSGDPGQKSRTQ